MSHGKQFTLYSHARTANGWKAAFVIHELGLTYEPIYLNFQGVDGGPGEHKQPAFLKINPNGRIPALIDHHNNDFVVWESCAIISYLVEKYDKERKISGKTLEDNALILQWLFFQASGQGPYYGQAAWFKIFHHEKLESAIKRYEAEIVRVLGVLEGVLSERDWLVADKYTVADVSFLPWNQGVQQILSGTDVDVAKQFPKVTAWQARIEARPAIKEALEAKAKLLAGAGH